MVQVTRDPKGYPEFLHMQMRFTTAASNPRDKAFFALLADLPPIGIPVVTSYSLSIQLQELVDGYSWHHADVP